MSVKCKDNNENDKDTINTPSVEINNICNAIIDRDINIYTSPGFNLCLREIGKTLKPDTADIERLDYLFKIYTYLCAECRILPDISGFCVMIDVHRDTVYSWASGEKRTLQHADTVKKWQDFCKATCISEAGAGNIGAIYVSKSVHGMRDNDSVHIMQIQAGQPIMSAEQIAQQYGNQLIESKIDVPDIDF
jgi:hypothetical protein